MSADILHMMRELDSRVSDGIHVRLLWSEHHGRVAVAVADAKTDDAFAVDVHESDNALDVFQHPYAYAAWRGIETRGDVAGVANIALLAAA